MHKTIIDNYNDIIKESDTCFHIGDFSLTTNVEKLADILRKLHGTKILILGSHDNFKPFTYVGAGFESVHTMLEFNQMILNHDPCIASIEPFRRTQVICGHVHALFKTCRNAINVGVDVWEFKPVGLEEIQELQELLL